jgi:hypothetical protein
VAARWQRNRAEHVPFGHLDGSRRDRHDSGVELEVGVRLHLPHVRSLDDLCDVTAPALVQPGDIVASAEYVYRVEVVLVRPPGAPVVPVLVRPVELTMSTYA